MFKVLIVAFLCLSCSPCYKSISSQQRDSVSVELRPRIIEIRDTLSFVIPHHEQGVVVREDSSFLSNPYATSTAKILSSGELRHTLESLPQILSQGYESRVEVRDSIIYRLREEVKIVEVERELTRWQKLQMRGFWLLVMLVGGVFFGRFMLKL